ncbi:MAG: DnaJ C-terminal domain-containing protein [Lentisphaeria bacterium]|nr:DnaJ C-terminal domain-containing protein [Lentisphaeria bacterium]
MPVKFKDYYAILGVPRSATDADIKQAFRKLARKYHPDVAKGKDKAADDGKFKDINEANEVLSDPDKRRKYDELGANWDRPGRQASQQQSGFGGGFGQQAEFHFEGTGFSDFFEQFFASRGQPFGDSGRTGRQGPGMGNEVFAQRGRDIEGDILVTLDEIMHGSTRRIQLRRVDPRTGQSKAQTLQVKIPPGVREAQLIRLAGKGGDGLGGADSGNLYLRVRFAKHPDFRVRGTDLYHDLELAPWEAVLGTTVRIPVLDGTVSLKIPAGTAAERRFRLRGKGLPTGDGTRGDLYAVVTIQLPTRLTPEQKALWEQLAETSTFNPRKT